jgi:hypothetical protein
MYLYHVLFVAIIYHVIVSRKKLELNSSRLYFVSNSRKTSGWIITLSSAILGSLLCVQPTDLNC